jgi:hypothetical protein
MKFEKTTLKRCCVSSWNESNITRTVNGLNVESVSLAMAKTPTFH